MREALFFWEKKTKIYSATNWSRRGREDDMAVFILQEAFFIFYITTLAAFVWLFSYFFCGFSNFIRGRVKEGLIFANINFSGQLVQKWPPHLANGSDLLWEDIGPDISCKNTTDWYWRFEINFPSKVFFSEITFETFEMNFPTKVFFWDYIWNIWN